MNDKYKCVKCGAEYVNYGGTEATKPKQCVCGHTLRKVEVDDPVYYPTPVQKFVFWFIVWLGLICLGDLIRLLVERL